MIRSYDWPHEIENIGAVDGIGHELAYFRYSEVKGCGAFVRSGKYPHKFGFFMLMLCTSGSVRMRINLDEYDAAAPAVIRIMPG
ncbi:MAG: hypothetical protein NC114_11925 [Ruminococcus flavefaciens]|nr:hypothetical protein [Ruminococcus flavefaciens]